MRTVRVEGASIKVSDDPNRIIAEFIACALSLGNLSGRALSEEFVERFSPQGHGMQLPDTFVAYRPEGPDGIPLEFGQEFLKELGRKELWVLTPLRYGEAPRSVIIEGPELRQLLSEALAQSGQRSDT